MIPITGTFLSGTEFYTKTYINITSGSLLSGGFFQTTFDGAPTSISASALVDFSYGQSTASLLSAFNENLLNNEKQRMYKQMATLLLGSKSSLFSFNSTNYHELFFISFKRRIFKDEIKKGSVSLVMEISGAGSPVTDTLTLTDTGAATSFTVGPAGDEGNLLSGSTPVGKVYYNAGVIAFITGIFYPVAGTGQLHWSGTADFNQAAISGNIDNIITGFRNHISSLNFQNQTNLHSTIYFCRALNADFNYSANSTFVDSDGRILVTSGTDNQTRTYPTTIGLYGINNDLLAVAKTSEPIKKSPDTEVIFRVRLIY